MGTQTHGALGKENKTLGRTKRTFGRPSYCNKSSLAPMREGENSPALPLSTGC